VSNCPRQPVARFSLGALQLIRQPVAIEFAGSPITREPDCRWFWKIRQQQVAAVPHAHRVGCPPDTSTSQNERVANQVSVILVFVLNLKAPKNQKKNAQSHKNTY
jgi:hypothetical protein